MHFNFEVSFASLVRGASLFFFGLTVLVLCSGVRDFFVRLKRHLRRWAPIYLVAGPPSLTYLCGCGGLSFFYYIYLNKRHGGLTHDQMYAAGILTTYQHIEYFCSFAAALLFAVFFRWLGLLRPWFWILWSALSVTAAYRTGRLDANAVTGPTIVLSPELGDILPVALGAAIFLFYARRITEPTGEQRLGSGFES